MNFIKFSLFFLIVAFSLSGFSQVVNRVISLTPSITENIYLIKGESKLVGCTSFCTQALEDGIEQVGSAIDVNVEKIFSLKPDLVLTMELTKTQDLETMKRLGINVVVIKTPKNFDEICTQTQYIADLMGLTENAKRILWETKQKVSEIKGKCASLPRQKIFFQIGANPIFTVLKNTFMEDYIDFCNGTNIAAELNKGTMTRESVLAQNPNVIIIASMGGFGEEELEIWKHYTSIDAVKNNRVFLIPSETSCSPTPLNFASALYDVFTFVSNK